MIAAAATAVWALAAGRLPRWVLAVAVAAGSLLIVSALLSDAPIAQLFGRAQRYEGLVALPVVLVAVWIGARMLGPDADTRRHRTLLMAGATAATALAAVAVLEALGLRPLDTDLARPGSLAGNAGDQGLLALLYLAVLGSMLVGIWTRERRVSAWATIGVLAALVGVITSASRAAGIGTMVVVAFVGVRLILSSQRRVAASALVAGSVTVIAVSALAVPAVRSRLFGEWAGIAGASAADRLRIWGVAGEVVWGAPALGVGPSGYQDAVTRVLPSDWYRTVSPTVVLESPHNWLLQAAVAGGIPGLLGAAAVFVAVVVVGIRRIRGAAAGAGRDLLWGSLAAVCAGAVTLLAQPTSPKTLLLLGLLGGCLIALPSGGGGRRSRRVRAVTSGLFAVWFALIAVWTGGDVAMLQGLRAAAAGDARSADARYTTAQALRPWDADVALSAAQSLGSIPPDGVPDVSALAAAWAVSAARQLPASAAAAEAEGMTSLFAAHSEEEEGAAAATVALGRAVTLSPQNPRLWHEYGLAAFAIGDLVTARAAFERASILAPDADISRRALADVCARLGDAGCSADAGDESE